MASRLRGGDFNKSAYGFEVADDIDGSHECCGLPDGRRFGDGSFGRQSPDASAAPMEGHVLWFSPRALGSGEVFDEKPGQGFSGGGTLDRFGDLDRDF